MSDPVLRRSCVAVAMLALSPATTGQLELFTWELAGNPFGSGQITAEGLQVTGPDGWGVPCDPSWTAWQAVSPVGLRISVEADFLDLDVWPGPNCFDAPAVIVGDEVHVPPGGACSGTGWPSGTYHFEVEVPPGVPFGLGVHSVDCFEGPGVATFSHLEVEVLPVFTFEGAIDPRELWAADGLPEEARVLAPAADFDGDGVADVAAGTPDEGTGVGRIAVLSGSDGAVLFEQVGHKSFGYAVIGVGDLTGDGQPDLAVGSPTAPNASGVGSAGVAQLLSGADGAEVYRLEGGTGTKRLGHALALSGDVDGDRVDDVLIGAPALATGLIQNGKVRVVSGATGAVIRTLVSPESGLRFGWAVAAADLDGDGVDDHVVGAPPQSAPAGRVVAHSGADGSVLWSRSATGSFGRSLAVAGDLGGDGIPELLAGAPQEFSAGVAVGAVHVLDGATGDVLQTFLGAVEDGRFGSSVAFADDVDGDGVPDLAITSEGAQLVSILSWPGGALVNTLPVVAYPQGKSVTSPGDLDGDGLSDLVTSGPLAAAWHGLMRPGPPSLTTTGDPVPGAQITASLADAPLGVGGVLVVGTAGLAAPFKGGTLWPQPDVVVPLDLSADGTAELAFRWPEPQGAWWAVWLQAWFPDPYGPEQATCTDAVAFSGE